MKTTVIGSGKKVAENGKAAAAEVKNAGKVAEKVIEKAEPAKPSISDLQKQIEEQIARFQRKSELIAQRDRFISTKDQLVDHLKEMGADFDERLDNPRQKIVLMGKEDAYVRDGISISNNELVFEFIRMLLQKVIEKIQKLEAEIVS